MSQLETFLSSKDLQLYSLDRKKSTLSRTLSVSGMG